MMRFGVAMKSRRQDNWDVGDNGVLSDNYAAINLPAGEWFHSVLSAPLNPSNLFIKSLQSYQFLLFRNASVVLHLIGWSRFFLPLPLLLLLLLLRNSEALKIYVDSCIILNGIQLEFPPKDFPESVSGTGQQRGLTADESPGKESVKGEADSLEIFLNDPVDCVKNPSIPSSFSSSLLLPPPPSSSATSVTFRFPLKMAASKKMKSFNKMIQKRSVMNFYILFIKKFDSLSTPFPFCIASSSSPSREASNWKSWQQRHLWTGNEFVVSKMIYVCLTESSFKVPQQLTRID